MVMKEKPRSRKSCPERIWPPCGGFTGFQQQSQQQGSWRNSNITLGPRSLSAHAEEHARLLSCRPVLSGWSGEDISECWLYWTMLQPKEHNSRVKPVGVWIAYRKWTLTPPVWRKCLLPNLEGAFHFYFLADSHSFRIGGSDSYFSLFKLSVKLRGLKNHATFTLPWTKHVQPTPSNEKWM